MKAKREGYFTSDNQAKAAVTFLSPID